MLDYELHFVEKRFSILDIVHTLHVIEINAKVWHEQQIFGPGSLYYYRIL